MIQSLIIAQGTIVFHGLNLKIQLMKIQLIRLIIDLGVFIIPYINH
jgi:hypothetical protein